MKTKILIIVVIILGIILSLRLTGVLELLFPTPTLSEAQSPTQAGQSEIPLKIIHFTASQTQINKGDPVDLSWDVSGADSISIYPNIGKVPAWGLKTVLPTAETTYTLTASKGNVDKSLAITIKLKSAQAGGPDTAVKSPLNIHIVFPEKVSFNEVVDLEVVLKNIEETTLKKVVLYQKTSEYLMTAQCDKLFSQMPGGVLGLMVEIGDLMPGEQSVLKCQARVLDKSYVSMSPGHEVAVMLTCDYDNVKDQQLCTVTLTLDPTGSYYTTSIKYDR